MKRKFFAIAATAVICLLFTTAYAYNAVDGSKWVESIKADTESKKVTITFSDDFINNYAPNGYRGAVFTEKPQLITEGDAGFWAIFRAVDGTDELAKQTLASGFSGGGKEYIMDASGLTEGKNYYLAVTGNNAGLSPDWTWTEQTWEFVYSTETSATGDVSAAVWAGIALIGCGVLLAVVYATKKMRGETV